MKTNVFYTTKNSSLFSPRHFSSSAMGQSWGHSGVDLGLCSVDLGLCSVDLGLCSVNLGLCGVDLGPSGVDRVTRTWKYKNSTPIHHHHVPC